MWVRVLLCGLLALCAAVPALAQPALWEAQASMRDVAQLSPAPGAVWAATDGGVFRYEPGSGAFERFTRTDGLTDTRAAAIAYDARREVVWIGYASGVLDRLDPETGAVASFRDIARAERFSERRITRIRVEGDSVFVATAFGVVVFDPVKGEVRDTYSQLGRVEGGTAVFDVAVAPGPGGRTLWVSTPVGLVAGPLDGRNLQDPASWMETEAGLPAGETRGLALFDGRLHVATPNDLYARSHAGQWQATGYTGSDFYNLAATEDLLIAHERFAFVGFHRGGPSFRVTPSTPPPSTYLVIEDVALVGGYLVSADQRESLALMQADPFTFERFVMPPGPGFNVVADLDFAADGTLWTASSGGGGEGFQKRDPDGTWTVYDRQQNPDLLGNAGDFQAVEIAPDGTAWLGSEGHGIARVSPDGEISIFNRHNSTLRQSGSHGNPDYISVTGLATEKDGTLWATNRLSARPLHVRRPDGTWTSFAPFVSGGLLGTYNYYDRILIDGFGTKWILLRDERQGRFGRGLIAYDSGRNPADPSDDAVRYFGEEGGAGSGLPALLVTSIVEDRDGRIWIGTEKGIAYLVNNGIVPHDRTSNFVWPVDASERAYVLRGLRINALAVDPANALWVGSEDGLWRVEEREGGFRITAHFTAENSPLPSNRVLSVEVSALTGEVYIGTDAGLISYRGGIEAPAPSARDLFVFPNPARATGDALPEVTIRGLVEQTDLRIVSPDGRVVRQLGTRGGSAIWDGRDGDGRLVPSGMYLIVAVGRNGEGAAFGKVAVIR